MRKYYVHLTNYSLNKMSANYIPPDEESNLLWYFKFGDFLLPNEASKRTMSSVMKSLEAAGMDTELMEINMKHLIMKVKCGETEVIDNFVRQ